MACPHGSMLTSCCLSVDWELGKETQHRHMELNNKCGAASADTGSLKITRSNLWVYKKLQGRHDEVINLTQKAVDSTKLSEQSPGTASVAQEAMWHRI